MWIHFDVCFSLHLGVYKGRDTLVLLLKIHRFKGKQKHKLLIHSSSCNNIQKVSLKVFKFVIMSPMQSSTIMKLHFYAFLRTHILLNLLFNLFEFLTKR